MDVPAEAQSPAEFSGGVASRMITPSKPMSPNPASARGQLFRVAVVGAASLKGKEVAEVLNERNFPAIDVRLLDDDDHAQGQLEAVGEEVSFIQSVRAEQFEHVDFAFFAGDARSTRHSWKDARDAGCTIVDLSGALEGEPGAAVRSVWTERELGIVPAPDLQPGPSIVPHPGAVMLALLLLRLRKAGPLLHAVATLHEPASEIGQKGMDELHQQTVNLLSFQPLPKDVYDAQIAFNLLPRYGVGSENSLAAIEARILRDLQRIGGPESLLASLNLLQAPVFHGLAVSLFIELQQATGLDGVAKALNGDHITVVTDSDPPSNVSAAGQGDILVSIQKDALRANGFWLWAVADNLRVAALNAVECAESLASTRPVGKIQ
jgi:aspartate-semialdehyde dehydrogenase